MNATSVVESCARRWSAAYTIGLPADVRDRRRTEIESDLWEHQHDREQLARVSASASLAIRVVLGMPADLGWRVAERRPRGRLDVRNFAVDRAWDRRMRVAGRAAVVLGIACYVPIAVGVPPLLAITVPVGALALSRLPDRDTKEQGMKNISITHQRRTRATVLGVCLAVFMFGLWIDSLPSQATHDDYWMLFVAPMMIAVLAGAVVLPMLVWSYLPRRETHDGI